MKTAIILSILGLGLAQAAFAETRYVCSFPAGRDDFIPETVQLAVDTSTWRAQVLEKFTKAKHGGAIAAKAKRRDGKSIQFNWEVEVPYTRNRTSQADYRIILNHTNMTASLRGDIPGNIDPSIARGRCRVAN
ncbi:hypothetical protein ACFORG_23470 [Lutimaribacter marinistellae]|uniref:Uncharacterized protein n=1 Tax=Lutimaribacter marinistellae TaxID=1820329 RepID=A0ABV7TND9_9RHOB